MTTAPHYHYSTVGYDYTPPSQRGFTTLPVLPELLGRPWGDDAMNVLHELRPSQVRVIPIHGLCEDTFSEWRVTVVLNADNTIRAISQEVQVGCVGRSTGAEVSAWLQAGVAPKTLSPELVLFARSLRAMVTMVENDVREGVYGRGGRPNFTSLWLFVGLGLANVPELLALAESWFGPAEAESARATFGTLDDLRTTTQDLRTMITAIPPEKGRYAMATGSGLGEGLSMGPTVLSPGERAELLAILDGVTLDILASTRN